MSKKVELTDAEIDVLILFLNDTLNKAFKDRFVNKKNKIPDQVFFEGVPLMEALLAKLTEAKDA